MTKSKWIKMCGGLEQLKKAYLDFLDWNAFAQKMSLEDFIEYEFNCQVDGAENIKEIETWTQAIANLT